MSHTDINGMEEHPIGRINIEDGLGHRPGLRSPYTKERPTFDKTYTQLCCCYKCSLGEGKKTPQGALKVGTTSQNANIVKLIFVCH